MSTTITPFEPGAALARIAATPTGWQIDCRGPYGARHYDFVSTGEAAEFAIILRDKGNWPLRFSPGAETVKVLVEEISAEGEP
ncbi:hypothetical protein D3273_22475 [Lichenibacterium minor]|uniref:Uncharacterized protein n=1 Tax=Lichenibacterium minor TaxID=2316528 RepID=A0A4Q2U1W9_9HYPH|nr:hypothetical protein [Lichenibacterium minor]RYC29708.1 hypothetical protein D3273_22475 [Lichenibacterium minor]